MVRHEPDGNGQTRPAGEPRPPRTTAADAVDAATSTLYGAARRTADFVARADDPERAAMDGREVLRVLLDGLRP